MTISFNDDISYVPMVVLYCCVNSLLFVTSNFFAEENALERHIR